MERKNVGHKKSAQHIWINEFEMTEKEGQKDSVLKIMVEHRKAKRNQMEK